MWKAVSNNQHETWHDVASFSCLKHTSNRPNTTPTWVWPTHSPDGLSSMQTRACSKHWKQLLAPCPTRLAGADVVVPLIRPSIPSMAGERGGEGGNIHLRRATSIAPPILYFILDYYFIFLIAWCRLISPSLSDLQTARVR